jgi:DNA-binding GntR family transcriptional regulator
VISLVSHDDPVSIDPDSGVPKYRQLADILRGRIERGEITRKVPGEKYLMEDYGVALGTVRQAIALLREDGVVFTTPGLGTFVRKPGGE